MKWYSKAIVIFCNVVFLNIVNQCMAIEKTDNEYVKDKEKYIDKVYYVEQSKEQEFMDNLNKEITVNGTKFTYIKNDIEQQYTVDIKPIETTKKIKLNTNNRVTIINELGTAIDYNEDGYVGTYQLNKDSIKIVTHDNGYYDTLIEKTEEYQNLCKNDLDYIPKQIDYKGKTLDLLSTKWEETATSLIGNVDVPSKYKAICYYATKERIYRPNTYTITAQYNGEAKKEITKPSKITVTYKEKVVEQPIIEEKGNNTLILMLGGTGTIIIFLGGIFLFMNNVKIYNYQKGRWNYVGKALLINKRISLNKFINKEITNKYRIELTKELTKKYGNKTIEIHKGINKINQVIHTNNEIMDFEIRI